MDRDFRRAKKACGNPCGTGSPGSVSKHGAFPPWPGNQFPPTTGGVVKDGNATRQTNLASMGMSAELEVVAECRSFPMGFRGMGKQDGHFS